MVRDRETVGDGEPGRWVVPSVKVRLLPCAECLFTHSLSIPTVSISCTAVPQGMHWISPHLTAGGTEAQRGRLTGPRASGGQVFCPQPDLFPLPWPGQTVEGRMWHRRTRAEDGAPRQPWGPGLQGKAGRRRALICPWFRLAQDTCLLCDTHSQLGLLLCGSPASGEILIAHWLTQSRP